MKKKIIAGFLLAVLALTMTACKGYDTPEFKTLTPSQTGFLVPLTGKTSDQKTFDSEAFLESAKVASKRIQIPHIWVETSSMGGEYMPTMNLITVERKPESREWTEKEATGTSSKNEGITAESKESIGFMARMNCSAQIDEPDASKFLYRYNSKPLAEVMDQEIRTRVESKFVEECGKRELDKVLSEKELIMKAVRDDSEKFFKERGITITVIGMKGELTYLNPEIQAAIDNKFKTAQAVISQANENQRVISKAEADSKAIAAQASTLAQSIRLRELDVQMKQAEAAVAAGTNWRPNMIGANVMQMMGIDASGNPK
jgi:regulator of protease activity HflC (stomatin/prohibitin superfamily)